MASPVTGSITSRVTSPGGSGRTKRPWAPESWIHSTAGLDTKAPASVSLSTSRTVPVTGTWAASRCRKTYWPPSTTPGHGRSAGSIGFVDQPVAVASSSATAR